MRQNATGRLKTESNAVKQRGLQTVELALLFPIVLLVIFAIVGYSLMFMVQHTLNSAVSQAARVVAVANSTASPEAAARQLLVNALPAAISSSGFSFTTVPQANAGACGNTLNSGTNPTLSCLEFRGAFNIANNPFISNLPFADVLLPNQLSASTVVLYQNTNAL